MADHTHPMAHNHAGSTTALDGAHAHTAGSLAAGTTGSIHGHNLNPAFGGIIGMFGEGDLGMVRAYDVNIVATNINVWPWDNPPGSGSHHQGLNLTGQNSLATASGSGSHTHTLTGTSSTATAHTHTLNLSNSDESSSGPSPIDTTGASTGTTGSTGTGTSFSNVPASKHVRYIIRAI
jgi:hypothetical protein